MNNGYQILNEPDDQAPDDDLSFDEKEKCNKKVKKEKKADLCNEMPNSGPEIPISGEE